MTAEDPTATTVTLERLAELVAAYGAAPERWPEVERVAAERLIVQSAAARALRDAAAALDRLLDAAPSAPPSGALAARVLAAAPHPRRPRAWRIVLAGMAPLAAAAAVALWLASTPEEPARHVATTRTLDVVVGQYASPTDVLLDSYALADAYTTVPSIGCFDSSLGCPRIDAAEPAAPSAEPFKGGA
jgi:hypothetical protein